MWVEKHPWLTCYHASIKIFDLLMVSQYDLETYKKCWIQFQDFQFMKTFIEKLQMLNYRVVEG